MIVNPGDGRKPPPWVVFGATRRITLHRAKSFEKTHHVSVHAKTEVVSDPGMVRNHHF